MATFVDTSGIVTLLDADDERHERADQFWAEIVSRGELLIATNYVVVETFSVVQRRLGMAAIRAFYENLMPIIRVDWVDEALHEVCVAAVLGAGRRQLSLVDYVSFEVMRRLGLDQAFAFDPDFEAQGFTCLP